MQQLLWESLESLGAACALCPRSRQPLVVPYAVCRYPGTSHCFNDNDHDEMKDTLNIALLFLQYAWPSLCKSVKDLGSTNAVRQSSGHPRVSCKRRGPDLGKAAMTIDHILS